MKVSVTQEDKDASAELAVAIGMSAETFTSGAADVIVQAFARHRLAAEATGKAEIEGLRSYIVECDENASAEWNALRGALAAIIAEPDCCAASKAIARAGLSEEAQSISDREAALTELIAVLGAARTMLRRAANTAKTVGLARDLNRQADNLDAAIAKAKAKAKAND